MAKKAKPKKQYSKGWETRRANAAKLGTSPHKFASKEIVKTRRVVADELGPFAEAQAINAVRDDWNRVGEGMKQVLYGDNSPGHGEIVGGADAKLADELVALARTKGGKDKVQAKLHVIQAQARYEGQKATDEVSTKRLIDVQQKMADSVVCSLIAEVEAAQRYHSGLPRSLVWNISSFTLLRVIDALNAAGYTSRGKR